MPPRRSPRTRLAAACAIAPALLAAATLRGSPRGPLPPARKPPAGSFFGLSPLKPDLDRRRHPFYKGPLPPARVGEVIRIPLAAPAAPIRPPARLDPGRLAVVRRAPVGRRHLVGSVSARFNQPMVPVAALADLDKWPVPLRIRPAVPGRTRWLGTRTAVFETDKRLPFSTRYVVTVPAGSRSAAGRTLARAVSWRFETPRLAATWRWPRGDQNRPDTVIAISFNQRVDRAELHRQIRFKGPRGRIHTALVPPEQWASLPGVGGMLGGRERERTLVLRPLGPLPTASRFSLSIPTGAPSSEGPLRSIHPISMAFSTYPRLKIRRAWCRQPHQRDGCYEGAPLRIETSTAIDGDLDLAALIEVRPKPSSMAVSADAGGILVSGDFQASTRYRLTVAPGLRDVFGQTTRRRFSARFSYRDGRPVLQLPSVQPVLLERHHGARLLARVRNLAVLRVALVRINPEQLHAARGFGSIWHSQRPPYRHLLHRVPPDQVRRFRVATGGQRNRLVRVPLEPWRALVGGRGGQGTVAVSVHAACPEVPDCPASGWASVLVQITDVGVTARWDHEQAVVMAARISTGASLPGARVELIDGAGRTLATATADRAGLATLPCKPWNWRADRFVLVTAGSEQGYVALRRRVHGPRYKRRFVPFVYTERAPYKPGETAHVTGMLRVRNLEREGGIEPVRGPLHLVWKLHSARGRQVAKGALDTSASGGFSLAIPLPDDMDLGSAYWRATIRTPGPYRNRSLSRSFEVQHYRTPEFEVKAALLPVPGGTSPERPPAAPLAGAGSRARTPSALFFGDRATMRVRGRYYFGAPMAGATVQYRLSRSPAGYRPPHHEGWHFGRVSSSSRTGRWNAGGANAELIAGRGRLDPQGGLRVPVRLDPGRGDDRLRGPATYRITAQVTDRNRQQIHASARAVVHQGAVYAGLRVDRAVVAAGTEVKVQVVAPAIDGRRTGRPVELELFRIVPRKLPAGARPPGSLGVLRGRDRPPDREVSAGRCTAAGVRPLSGRPVAARSCTFGLAVPGRYLVRARVRDAAGRANSSELVLWAHGPSRGRWALHELGRVELIADKAEYEPGETAIVLVKAPRRRARGFLTLERRGILERRPLRIDAGAVAVPIRLASGWVPNVHISAQLFTGRQTGRPPPEGEDPLRPRAAFGTLSLPIRRSEKRITVRVEPASPTLIPGGDLELLVRTLDRDGRPVAASLNVFAVDEGVLALLGFPTPDPLLFFHRPRPAGAVGRDARSAILVEHFQRLVQARPRPVRWRRGRRREGVGRASLPRLGGPAPIEESAEGAEPAPPLPASGSRGRGEPAASDTAGPAPALRMLFASTAFFRPGVRTTADGTAHLHVKMPQNPTTYRIMAVADDGRDRFGSGDGRITLRQPLVLRASLPRFASLHDDFDAAVTVHNHTGRRARIVVGGRASGVSWHDDFTRTLELDDGAARELHFRVRADKPGRATFQFAARVQGSSKFSEADAVQLSIPIHLPATLEAFATYGSTTGSVRQAVQAPAGAIPGFGGLRLKLSSTALSGLEDAARYLYEYPYECAEQTASRLLPIALLGDLLDDFDIGPLRKRRGRARLAARAARKLVQLQYWNGGFKLWTSSRAPSRWVTPWVTFALLAARQHGSSVAAGVIARANGYLRAPLPGTTYRLHPWWRSADVFAAWVLTHPYNDPKWRKDVQVRQAADRLYAQRDKLPVFARCWLAAVLARTGRKADSDRLLHELDGAITEKAGTAHLVEGRRDDLRILMHSSDRTDAIGLAALLELRPDHPLRDKLVRGLMQARIRGRWSTTQANAWALYAMREYYSRFEAVEPDLRARMWLGRAFLGEHAFKGRSLATAVAELPIDEVLRLAAGGRRPAHGGGRLLDFALDRRGRGRLYYRIGLRYAPKSLRLPPAEQGFTVQRSYRPLDPADNSAVRRLDDGSWRIRAGADLRVELTVVVPASAHYVVVDDPLPAGLEPTNPVFRTSAPPPRSAPPGGPGGWRWHWWWSWDHIEMRDDRVLLFADRLPAGVYTHSYAARATTVGRFVAGPARAEEMYAPETFGRTSTAIVEVAR